MVLCCSALTISDCQAAQRWGYYAPSAGRPWGSISALCFKPAEPHPDQFPNIGLSIRPFVDHREPLRLVWAQRQNDPSSGFDLIEDRRRQSLGGGRQQGSIVGRVLAPATRPVSDADGDIRAAELAQVRFGLACQLLHDFDAPHPTGKLGQDRGLIAQPGSDLEDALMRLGAEEVGHQRDYEGLREYRSRSAAACPG